MEKLSEKKPSIRSTRAIDAVEIRRMHAKVWNQTYPSEVNGVSQQWVEQETTSWFSDDKIEKSKSWIEQISQDSDHFHRVACVDKEIVGFIHGSRSDGIQRIEGLYIDPAYHGTGLAGVMVQELLDWFDTSVDIVLEVVDYNERAKSFYCKYAFEEQLMHNEKFKGVLPNVTMIRKGVSHEI